MIELNSATFVNNPQQPSFKNSKQISNGNNNSNNKKPRPSDSTLMKKPTLDQPEPQLHQLNMLNRNLKNVSLNNPSMTLPPQPPSSNMR